MEKIAAIVFLLICIIGGMWGLSNSTKDTYLPNEQWAGNNISARHWCNQCKRYH